MDRLFPGEVCIGYCYERSVDLWYKRSNAELFTIGWDVLPRLEDQPLLGRVGGADDVPFVPLFETS